MPGQDTKINLFLFLEEKIWLLLSELAFEFTCMGSSLALETDSEMLSFITILAKANTNVLAQLADTATASQKSVLQAFYFGYSV